MNLRDYQSDALERIAECFERGVTRVLLALGTGSGKTVIAADFIRKRAHMGFLSVFIVPRIELVSQSVAHFEALGLTVGVYQGDSTHHPADYADVYVASIQTIRSRGWPPPFVVMRPLAAFLIDEAHIVHKAHAELLAEHPDVPVIGLTATPCRPDLGGIYKAMIHPVTVDRLTRDGYLSPLRIFCPNYDDLEAALRDVDIDYRAGDYKGDQVSKVMRHKKIVGDVLETWQRHASDRQTIAFACNVAHAEQMADAFTAEGIDAAVVTYRTDADERVEYIRRFRDGDLRVLWSVNALSEGFDVPNVQAAIMARPTLSPTVFFQQAGRAMRISEGKTDSILLDHAGNVHRFGLPIDFEPPELGAEVIEWKAAKGPVKRKVKTCSECGAVVPPLEFTCQECGNDLPRKSPKVTAVEGELAELGKEPEPHSLVEKYNWYSQLLGHVRARGYKTGWAAWTFKDKFGHFPIWQPDEVPPKAPGQTVARYIRHKNIRYAKSKQRSQARLS